MIDNTAVNWRYRSEPNESVGNRQIYVPRAKILGGTSSINGTIYNRGQRIDYDTWAQMRCRGWGYDDVLPYLKKLESTKIGDDKYRGRRRLSGDFGTPDGRPIAYQATALLTFESAEHFQRAAQQHGKEIRHKELHRYEASDSTE